jgi:hypothetical protein
VSTSDPKGRFLAPEKCQPPLILLRLHTAFQAAVEGSIPFTRSNFYDIRLGAFRQITRSNCSGAHATDSRAYLPRRGDAQQVIACRPASVIVSRSMLSVRPPAFIIPIPDGLNRIRPWRTALG